MNYWRPADLSTRLNLLRVWRWVVVLLLVLMFLRQLTSIRDTSPTYDEYNYIARGYTYLRTGDTRLQVRHPILLDALAASPLLLQPDIQLPLDSRAWESGDFHWYSAVFLWESNGPQVNRIVFLSRLPLMLLSLLLAAGVFRWASHLGGLWAGLLAMALCTWDPNLLAHSRLVTPDAGQATLIFLASLAWWRFLEKPAAGRWVTAGVLLGLAQAAGFPALMLYPVMALTALLYGWRHRRGLGAARLLGWWAGLVVLSAFTLWGVYGFSWGVVRALGVSVPAPYHWEEFASLIQRLQRQDLAYCCGRVYRGGWWPFFMVALVAKTPIATLLLGGVGALVLLRRQDRIRVAALGLLPILYYGTALAGSLNIGYRHILPVLPFLFVTGGQVVGWAVKRWRRVMLIALVAWLGVVSAWIHPFYLAYFSELAGGPANGQELLVVSDLDWGQDLPRLARYLEQQEVKPTYLSWFGTMPPSLAGIDYRPLPAYPPMEATERLPFHPDYPLPGLYAISAANLVGARLPDQETFGWFQQREPIDRIGYSILIYQVPRLLDTAAPTVNIGLAGLPLSDLPAALFEQQFRTNDLALRWFDAQKALVLPAGGGWLAYPETSPPSQVFRDRFLQMPPLAGSTRDGENRYQLYDVDTEGLLAAYRDRGLETELAASPVLIPDPEQIVSLSAPIHFSEAATLLGYEIIQAPSSDGSEVLLLTCWQVDQPPRMPLAIFVHLLGPDGAVLGQHDGLDVPIQGWYGGDVIIQAHRFTVDPAAAGSAQWMQVGLYRPDTMERLPARADVGVRPIGDRVLIRVSGAQDP